MYLYSLRVYVADLRDVDPSDDARLLAICEDMADAAKAAVEAVAEKYDIAIDTD